MACANILIGHRNWVQDVVFSPGGDRLASASDDCTIRLWNVATGDCCLILTGHEGGGRRVSYSPKRDVYILASGSYDRTARLWDVASGQCRALLRNIQGVVLGVAG